MASREEPVWELDNPNDTYCSLCEVPFVAGDKRVYQTRQTGRDGKNQKWPMCLTCVELVGQPLSDTIFKNMMRHNRYGSFSADTKNRAGLPHNIKLEELPADRHYAVGLNNAKAATTAAFRLKGTKHGSDSF